MLARCYLLTLTECVVTLWAYASPSTGLYAWSRDHVRSLGGVSLSRLLCKHVRLLRFGGWYSFEFDNGSGLWR